MSLLLALTVLLFGCAPRREGGAAGSAEPLVTSSGVPTVFLSGGEFTMGSERGNADESPRHVVQLGSFLIDAHEVTQAMFAEAQLPNPSKFNDDPQRPVERVRWRDAKIYCNERSILEGLQPCYDENQPGLPCDFDANGYRLPTEAEWEYACRAGSGGDFDFGAQDKLKRHAYYEENSDGRTHAVQSRKPNAWGIYGMYGNVCEWCQDGYDPDYYRVSPRVDPRGPQPGAKDEKRVIRGGSWKASAGMCRASFRQGQRTGDTDACFSTDYCGFRCVRRLTADEFQRLKNGGKANLAPPSNTTRNGSPPPNASLVVVQE